MLRPPPHYDLIKRCFSLLKRTTTSTNPSYHIENKQSTTLATTGVLTSLRKSNLLLVETEKQEQQQRSTTFVLTRSSYKSNTYKYNRKCFSNSFCLFSSSSSSNNELNELNLNTSQRLMRKIYSRVHPDLFTNHLEARKLNEESLKILRNLIDYYSSSVNISSTQIIYKPANKAKYIEFYLKNYHKISEEAQLTKFRINLISDSIFSLDDQLCQVFDEFINHLSLPVKKFGGPKKRPSFIKQTGNSRYRVTYKYSNVNFDQNDEFRGDEEFERWYVEMVKRNQVPSLRKWIKDNQEAFNARFREATSIKAHLEKNKRNVIKRWKLKDLTFKSNWSLQTCNSYLIGLLNYPNDNFEGFTLVLTTNNNQGLQKNGKLYLNCNQVYEEWLYVLSLAKDEVKLLKEISEMEYSLSLLLNGIQICDNLDKTFMANITDYENIYSAKYYSQLLNHILNRFTSELGEDIDVRDLINEHNFSHLKLTIQNTKNIELNSLGQFVLGNWTRITYKETLRFIKDNDEKAVNFYRDYAEASRKELQMKANLTNLLELKDIKFNEKLNTEQKKQTMNKLTDLADKSIENDLVLNTLKKADHLFIGDSYVLNDDSSITIPWNWFEFKQNNG